MFEGRGEYTYLARRISKQKEMPAKDIPVTYSGWYAFDPHDPRMIGYDYCTPDYVMGFTNNRSQHYREWNQGWVPI